METVEARIARRICELLGVPYPSEDFRQMKEIAKEETDNFLAESMKTISEALNSGDGSYHP